MIDGTHAPGGEDEPQAVTLSAPAEPYVVRVAPAVVATVVRRAVEQVPGVVRLANVRWPGRLWRTRASYLAGGIQLSVADGRARIAVHLVAARAHDLPTIGAAVQHAVAQSVETLVGMPVDSVDVFVRDVV